MRAHVGMARTSRKSSAPILPCPTEPSRPSHSPDAIAPAAVAKPGGPFAVSCSLIQELAGERHHKVMMRPLPAVRHARSGG